jgi:hypothetical protein
VSAVAGAPIDRNSTGSIRITDDSTPKNVGGFGIDFRFPHDTLSGPFVWGEKRRLFGLSIPEDGDLHIASSTRWPSPSRWYGSGRCCSGASLDSGDRNRLGGSESDPGVVGRRPARSSSVAAAGGGGAHGPVFENSAVPMAATIDTRDALEYTYIS